MAPDNSLYLNGRFLQPQDALISVFDRGNLFGDGVYEVIPVYSGRPYRLVQHLTRLDASLAAIGLANPHDQPAWRALIAQLIARQSSADLSLYLQLSRGAAGERDFAFPAADVPPTVLLYASPLITPSAAQKAAGVRAISHADFRWLRCDVKSLNLLPAVLMREAAKRQGCAETILFRDGFLSEGAASNIFIVKDGLLLAPPKSHLMLPGITYDVVLELCTQHGVPLEVRPILEEEVRAADEIWMSSSTKEVLAIVELDGRPVGDGLVGPLAKRLDALYQDFKQTVMRGGLA